MCHPSSGFMSLLGEQLNPGGLDQELALLSSCQCFPFYRLHLYHIDVLELLIVFFNSTLYLIHFYHHLNEQLDSSANMNTVLLNTRQMLLVFLERKPFS